MALAPKEPQGVVHEQSRPQHPRPKPIPFVGGEYESSRPYQVRRESVEAIAFAQSLEHQTKLELLEISNAAVNQATRARARPKGQIASLEQEDAQTAGGRITSDARTGDASPNDHEVVLRRPLRDARTQGAQLLGPPRRWFAAFGQSWAG